MGNSSSSGRRRDDYNQYPPPPPPPPRYPSAGSAPYPPPSHPGYSNPYQAPSPPPYNQYSLMPRSRYPPYYATHPGSGWWTSTSPMVAQPPPPPLPPPPFVEHQQAKTIKNDVNVHKDTIRLEPDVINPDHHLVSFTFDAQSEGSITIYYFAKEGTNCSFYPIYADMYTPTKVTFQKGIGQKFRQPSGSGFDLGFFELDDLLKPLNEDVYPLVIYAEAWLPPKLTDEQVGPSAAAAHAQITQAVIEKHSDGSFQVKVIKQILWVNGERYELKEIFGLANSTEEQIGGGDDMGKECVICLSEPRDTAVFPCRHLCMCSECAKALRLQSNKCPMCRQPVERLMEIKVNSDDR